jgi:hypothetical protein
VVAVVAGPVGAGRWVGGCGHGCVQRTTRRG